jgi:hypothetical protein
MGKIKRDPQIESGKMMKSYQDNIVDEILSQTPLQEKVSPTNMEREDVDLLQSVFDYYVQNRVEPDDEDYEMNHFRKLEDVSTRVIMMVSIPRN